MSSTVITCKANIIFTFRELFFLPTSRLPQPMPEVSASAEFLFDPLDLFLCLSRAPLSSSIHSSFNFSYLHSFGCTPMETPSSIFSDSTLSVTASNKLVSKEVSACYRRHMLQQAGYQEGPYWLPQEHDLETHSFRNI
jgi:hypothetical protein